MTPPDDRPALALDQLAFHEATLARVDAGGLPARLVLHLEGVQVGGAAQAVEAVFEAVTGLWRDDTPAQTLTLELPDAEVLTLEPRDGRRWALAILWRDFARQQSRTVMYGLEARAAVFRLAATPAG